MPADMRLELLSFCGHIFGSVLLNVVPTLYYLLKVVWVPLVFSAVCTVLEDHSIFWCFWQTRAWIQVFFFCQVSTKFCFSVLNQTWHTGNWFHESNMTRSASSPQIRIYRSGNKIYRASPDLLEFWSLWRIVSNMLNDDKNMCMYIIYIYILYTQHMHSS